MDDVTNQKTMNTPTDNAAREAAGIEIAVLECRNRKKWAESQNWKAAYVQALIDMIVILEPMALRLREGRPMQPSTSVCGEASSEAHYQRKIEELDSDLNACLDVRGKYLEDVLKAQTELAAEKKKSKNLAAVLDWIERSEILEERIPFPRKEEVLDRIRICAREALAAYAPKESIVSDKDRLREDG